MARAMESVIYCAVAQWSNMARNVAKVNIQTTEAILVVSIPIDPVCSAPPVLKKNKTLWQGFRSKVKTWFELLCAIIDIFIYLMPKTDVFRILW